MAPSRRGTETAGSEKDACCRAYVESLRQLASSTDSIYPGPHLENLAVYLERGIERFQSRDCPISPPLPVTPVGPDPYYVLLCNLRKPQEERVQKFKSADDFWEHTSDWSSGTPKSLVLFLRGSPSPEWLLAIGARYNLEYGFLSQHLHFRAAVGRPNYFGHPTLPSLGYVTQLRVTTVGGLVRESSHSASQDFVDELRSQNSKSIERHLADLRVDRNISIGESFIREFSTHDESHFSLEQDISIVVKESSSSWIAIVWMDHGTNLGQSPKMSWLLRPLKTDTWKISYFPTIHDGNSRGPALSRPLSNDSTNRQKAQSLFQSAMYLPEYYCSRVNANVAADDSFYALAEIFTFAAVSESQVLNLIESKITKETDPAVLVTKTDLSLKNLLYHKHILERHIRRLDENVRTIEARSIQHWPRYQPTSMDANAKKLVNNDEEKLLVDFQYLLSKAKSLSAMCDTGTKIIIQSLQVREAEQQIREARSVTSLTRLAFVFIPLTFVASIFGINVKQFGQGEVPIWVFFAIIFPIFIISVMLLFFYPRLRRFLRNVNEKRRQSQR